MKTFLENLGLSGNEIKVYQAALEIGESTATQLANRAKVHRVATYAIIDNLVNKGLLTQSGAKHGKRISATHPREIQTLIRKEQRRLKKMELKYHQVLPEFTALYQHASVLPRVQFFEGIRGLEQMNSDVINTLKELPEEERVTYSYSNPKVITELFEDYVLEEGGYIDKRKLYSIRNQVIALDSAATREIQKRDEQELRQMLILSEKQFPFKSDITIYANKIAIQALQKEFIGIIIESREIVQDQLALFHLAWAGAEALQQNESKN